MTTLYPHEVVAKWFRNNIYVRITYATLIFGITLITAHTIVNAINRVPTLDSNLMHPTAVYVTSCSSPTMMIIGSLVMILGAYFAFNLLSRGELV